jgi:hypothetical protein
VGVVFCAAAIVSGDSAIERKTSALGRPLFGFFSSICAEPVPGSYVVCNAMNGLQFGDCLSGVSTLLP